MFGPYATTVRAPRGGRTVPGQPGIPGALRAAVAGGPFTSKRNRPAWGGAVRPGGEAPYFTLTLMVLGLLSSRLGRVRCNTPFSKRAPTFSGSTLRGTWKARSKAP